MKVIFVAVSMVLLLAPIGTSTLILLDDFTDDTGPVSFPASPDSAVSFDIEGTSTDRQLSVQAAGTFTIVSGISGGAFVIDAGGSGGGSAAAEFEYLGFSFDVGTARFFRFSTSRIEGTPVLELRLGDAALGQISGSLQLTPVTSETVFSVDFTQFSGYLPDFGNTLESVSVSISDVDQPFFVEGNSFSFSEVPEPSSLFLVLASLPVIFGRHR